MRRVFGLGSWLLLAAIIIVAGSHVTYPQACLLAAGMALTLFNMILLLLCADALQELYEEHELRNT